MPLGKVSTGEAVRTYLIANSDLTDIVGEKFYPNKAPQNAVAPFVVYSVISDIPEVSMNGAAGTMTGEARVQLDSYSKKYTEAHTVSMLVEETLSDVSSSEFSAWKLNSRDLYDDSTNLHRVSVDMSVWR